MRVGIASQSDPAHESFTARCPDCRGTGAVFVGRPGSCSGMEECDACDGEGERLVDGDEVVTVLCRQCQGHGRVPQQCGDCAGMGWVGDGLRSMECGTCDDGQVEATCSDCDGAGEVTGPADEVCS